MNKNIFSKICKVYRKYSGDSNPEATSQMSLLWSGGDPPDILENTMPLIDLENEIDFGLTEDEAAEIFDMNLCEATDYLEKLILNWEKKNS